MFLLWNAMSCSIFSKLHLNVGQIGLLWSIDNRIGTTKITVTNHTKAILILPHYALYLLLMLSAVAAAARFILYSIFTLSAHMHMGTIMHDVARKSESAACIHINQQMHNFPFCFRCLSLPLPLYVVPTDQLGEFIFSIYWLENRDTHNRLTTDVLPIRQRTLNATYMLKNWMNHDSSSILAAKLTNLIQCNKSTL